MRLFTGAVALGALCACLGLVLMADEPAKNSPDNKGQQGGQARHFNAERFIKDFDKNNDGKLTKDELPAGLQEEFDQIDKDKDGHLSRQELEQYADHMGRQRPQAVEIIYYTIDVPEDEQTCVKDLQQTYEVLRKLDKNNDGRIDADEVKAYRQHRAGERVNKILKDLDRNSDGKISKDEARGLWAEDFAQLDKNNDGFLDRQEVQDALGVKKNAADNSSGSTDKNNRERR